MGSFQWPSNSWHFLLGQPMVLCLYLVGHIAKFILCPDFLSGISQPQSSRQQRGFWNLLMDPCDDKNCQVWSFLHETMAPRLWINENTLSLVFMGLATVLAPSPASCVPLHLPQTPSFHLPRGGTKLGGCKDLWDSDQSLSSCWIVTGS